MGPLKYSQKGFSQMDCQKIPNRFHYLTLGLWAILMAYSINLRSYAVNDILYLSINIQTHREIRIFLHRLSLNQISEEAQKFQF